MTPPADDSIVERHNALRRVVDAYFNGLKRNDLSQVPWHHDVALRTPLAPGGADTPILGDEKVREFFNAIAPLVTDVTVNEVYFADNGTSVAARADVSIAQPPCTLRVLDRFDVDNDNKIVEQENHFDPRPALAQPPQ
jgi:hypothetical protein